MPGVRVGIGTALCLIMSSVALAGPWIVKPSGSVPNHQILTELGHPEVLAMGPRSGLLKVNFPDHGSMPLVRGVVWVEPEASVSAYDVEGAGSEWLEPLQRVSLDDLAIQTQPAFLQAAVDCLSDRNDGTGVVVAVIDSGVDFDHPDSALTDTLAAGWDFLDDDGDPADTHGHGTRTAGLLAGLLPGIRIMPLRVLGDNAVGTTFDLSEAIYHATDNGADIINMSLGGPEDSQAVRDAVDYAVTRGVLVTAAAGNQDTSTPNYPAGIPEVIAVAGVDALDGRADFGDAGDEFASSYGNHVDVTAPAIALETTSWPDDFVRYDGTSGATALVTATLAAELAAGKTPDQAEEDLLLSSVDIDAANPGFEGLLGDGRIAGCSAVDR